MPALTDVMTRFYEILTQKVGTPVGNVSTLVTPTGNVTVKTERYYPSEFDISKLPLLAAVFREGSFSVQYGRDGDSYVVSTVQNVTVFAFVNTMRSGANGTQETLIIAEPLVDAIKACFLARTRLQLGAEKTKLDCLTKDIIMLPHSELSLMQGSQNIGIISFPFTVEYDEEITRV